MLRLRALVSLIFLVPTLALGQSGVYRFPGQIQAASGALASPSYSFTDDPDTGMYRVSADRLDLVVGGITGLDIQTTFTQIANPLRIGNGTNFNPAITFIADTDSGLYRIGADNIGISVNGAKILDIATTGLGVTGTVLTGNGTVSLPAVAFTSDPDSGIYRIGTNNIGIGVNGAKVLDIATTGLGVTGALSVSNGINITGGTAATETIARTAADTLNINNGAIVTTATDATISVPLTAGAVSGNGKLHQLAIDGAFTLPANAQSGTATATLHLGASGTLFGRIFTNSNRMGIDNAYFDMVAAVNKALVAGYHNKIEFNTNTGGGSISGSSSSLSANDTIPTTVTSIAWTKDGAVTLGPDTTTNAPLVTRLNTTANAKYTSFKGGGSNFTLAPSSNIAIPTGVSGASANSLIIINYGNVSLAGSALILCGFSDKAQIINTTGTAITETSTPGASQIGVLYNSTSGALTIYGGSLASGDHLIRITILGNGA
jgi:hypothetical protein